MDPWVFEVRWLPRIIPCVVGDLDRDLPIVSEKSGPEGFIVEPEAVG